MKRFGAIIAILFIVFSTLTPLWGVQDAQAQAKNPEKNGMLELSDVFGESQGGDFDLKPEAAGATKAYAGENTAVLNVRVAIANNFSPAEDTAEPKEYVWEGDYLGGWNAIFSDKIDSSMSEGIFLQLFEVGPAEKVTNTELTETPGPATYHIKQGGPEYSSSRLKFPTGMPFTTDRSKFIQQKNGNVLGNSGSYNISPFFLRINAPANFFGKRALSTNVVLTDLKPNTKYYYRIILEETGAAGDTAVTVITEQTSFVTTAVGTGNKSPEELDAVNGTSNGSSETSEVQSDAIFGASIRCTPLTHPGDLLLGCFALAYYNTIFRLSSFFLRGAAGLMDAFMAISLSSSIYQNSFIETGWTIVRDVCNIFFIFILLWTAFKMVINDHHYQANKTIVNIVVIGLLINFSLFFSRVIIDMGNISARVFYNQIRITGSAQGEIDEVAGALNTPDIKPKAISEALADGLNLTNISNTGYEKLREESGGEVDIGTIWLILLLGTFVNITAMWIFVKVSFAFLGRVLSLWVGMIMSPFAFTSTIIEGGGHGGGPLDVKDLGWKDWLHNMLEAAFYPAVYLFFIFLIIILIQSDFTASIMADPSGLTSTPFLIMTLFQFAFIIGLLVMSGKIAKKMSGTFGGQLTEGVGKLAAFAGGAAIGVASGGAARLGSKVFGGRAADWLSDEKNKDWKLAAQGDNEALKRMQNSNSSFKGMDFKAIQAEAEKKIKAKQKIAGRSFDIRNTAVGNTFSSATGLNLNAGLAKTGFGVDQTTGGAQASRDRVAYKKAEFLKTIDLSSEQRKKHEEEMKENKDKLEQEEKEIQDKIKALEGENSNYVQQAQVSGPNTVNAGIVKNNQDKIKALRGSLSKPIDPTTTTNLQAAGYSQPEIDNINANAAERAKLKKDITDNQDGINLNRKNAMRKYADFLHHNYDNAHINADDQNAVRRQSLNTVRTMRDTMLAPFRAQSWANMGDDLRQRIVGGLRGGLSGAMLGALTGSIPGAVLGAVVGSINGLGGGGVLTSLQRGFTNTLSAENWSSSRHAMGHALEAGHTHEPHGHAVYHTPHGSWFENLFKGNLGGGGGGHGGGHDDHGGGHH